MTRNAVRPPALHPSDAKLVDLAAKAEVEWTQTFRRDALSRARLLRSEVARRGLGHEVVRALESAPPGTPVPPRVGPTVRLTPTPRGHLPDLTLRGLADPEPPEVDDADVLSIEAAP